MIRIKASFVCFLIAFGLLIDVASTGSLKFSAIEPSLLWAFLGVGFKTRQIRRFSATQN